MIPKEETARVLGELTERGLTEDQFAAEHHLNSSLSRFRDYVDGLGQGIQPTGRNAGLIRRLCEHLEYEPGPIWTEGQQPPDDAEAQAVALGGEHWEALANFVGYGNCNAPVWFIGIEEGGIVNEESIGIRAAFDQFADLVEAQTALGFTHWIGAAPRLQSTWTPLTKLLHLMSASPLEDSAIRRYQGERLGRLDGTTCLCELLPLPSRGLREWAYSASGGMAFLASRREYEREALDCRIALLRTELNRAKPILVWGYGKSKWDQFEAVFPDNHWEEVRFSKSDASEDMVKLTTTAWGGLFVLTWHTATAQMNSVNRLCALSGVITQRLQEGGRLEDFIDRIQWGFTGRVMDPGEG